jgi:hypothetical protein
MAKRIRFLLVGVLLAICALPAHAAYWFRVPNANDLQWLLDSSQRVYLRNLSSFDGTVLGCCYNYWLDTNTPLGKSHWAALQVKIAMGESVWIAVSDQTQPGAIDFIADLD